MTLPSCPECGNKKIAVEFRDTQFAESDIVPREAYGTWFVCSHCGHSWPEDDNDELLWSVWEDEGGRPW